MFFLWDDKLNQLTCLLEASNSFAANVTRTDTSWVNIANVLRKANIWRVVEDKISATLRIFFFEINFWRRVKTHKKSKWSIDSFQLDEWSTRQRFFPFFPAWLTPTTSASLWKWKIAFGVSLWKVYYVPCLENRPETWEMNTCPRVCSQEKNPELQSFSCSTWFNFNEFSRVKFFGETRAQVKLPSVTTSCMRLQH